MALQYGNSFSLHHHHHHHDQHQHQSPLTTMPSVVPSDAIGNPNFSIKQQLVLLIASLHKVSQEQNIATDSGVSFTTSPPLHDLTSASTSVIGTTTANLEPVFTPISDSDVVVSSPTLVKSFFSHTSTTSPSPSLPIQAAVGSLSTPSPSTASTSSSDDFELQELWRAISRELKPVADVLRSARLRSSLGRSQLPSECVRALHLSIKVTATSSRINSSIMDAQVEIVRVLANLCIDHQQNRDILNTLSAASTLLSLLAYVIAQNASSSSQSFFSVPVLSLLRAAIGAVLNMQLEHIPTRQTLLNAESLAILTRVASHPQVYTPNIWNIPQSAEFESDPQALEKLKMGSTISSWAWRVVQEVCEDAKEENQQSNRAAQDDDDEENDPRAFLCRYSVGALLRPFLLYTPSDTLDSVAHLSRPHLDLDMDDVDELVEVDTDILLTASELIESCVQAQRQFRVQALQSEPTNCLGTAGSTFNDAATRFTSPLDLMMAFVEKAQIPTGWKGGDSEGAVPTASDQQAASEAVKTFDKVKSALARAVVAISGEDSNMATLFGDNGKDGSTGGWFIQRLKAWIQYDPKQRDDLVSCGMLAMGNLARTDANCLSLVKQHELAPFLASLLSPNNDIKVSHGLVSLLKNLSIPAANKAVIGGLNVIDAVVPYLGRDKDMVQPLQFGTVGLLKHLCAGVLDNAFRLVGVDPNRSTADATDKPKALEALLELINRVNDVPTKMEATRVLVNVTKSLWSCSASDSQPNPGGAVSNQVSRARKRVVRRDVVQALAEMVRVSPKYPVLVNEGIFALTLVGSEKTGAELVSLSLLFEPNKALADSAGSDSERSDNGDTGQLAIQPRRRSTHDSTASTSSHPLPPPPCALDMVCSVLARRDARMPPQFASNACMLVMSLCQASLALGERSVSGPEPRQHDQQQGQEAIVEVASKTRSVLMRLQDQGPVEALEPAAKALEAVIAVESRS